MEKNKKELKSFSILILALVGLTLIRSIVTVCIKGIPQSTEIPEGMTKELVQIVAIIAFAVGFVILIPQIYIGVKGILIANGAESGKAHIIWAIILLICSGIAVISGISDLVKAFDIYAVLDLLGPIIDCAVFAFYYIYARKVAQ